MRTYQKYMEKYPEVKAWLQNRPQGTQRRFAETLRRFCLDTGLEPEQWRSMDKFKARDVAWNYIEPKVREHSGHAYGMLAALKSFYRNKQGEQLPLDSGKGGKHHIRVRRKKAATEHIPNKKEMFQIIDMASNLRDKSILIMLFQAGVRVNVIEHLTYGDVQGELGKDTITLKVTGNLDYKLRGRDIPFYYTFLNGEGAQTFKRFCETKHGKSTPNSPLFPTAAGKAINQGWVWDIVKRCVEKAGFNPKNTSTHTIRKAFRKIVRQANIDDDDKEQLMGHVLQGSRENYFDRNTPDLILEAYRRCNFTRQVPASEVDKLETELREVKAQLKHYEDGMRLIDILSDPEVAPKFERWLKKLAKGK